MSMSSSSVACVLLVLASFLLLSQSLFREQKQIVGPGGVSQGTSTALNSDGTTLAVGGLSDQTICVWIFVREVELTTWSQQAVLIPADYSIQAVAGHAMDVQASQTELTALALSADGSVLAVGAQHESNSIGAVWIFTRLDLDWTQMGGKIVADNFIGTFISLGCSVSLNWDGSLLAFGGYNDNHGIGATWVFQMAANQTYVPNQGKVVGSNGVGSTQSQGFSVSLSSDSTFLAIGGYSDNSGMGAVWIFKLINSLFTQQGNKIKATNYIGTMVNLGYSVSLDEDGSTLAVGAIANNFYVGSVWIYTRIVTTWTEQAILMATDTTASTIYEGCAVCLTSDGNNVVFGGRNANLAWVYTRNVSSMWNKASRFTPFNTTGPTSFGTSVTISADAQVLAIGGPRNNNSMGATWVYSFEVVPTVSPTVVPTANPTISMYPSSTPSHLPTLTPTYLPSISPSAAPTLLPTLSPSTLLPSADPSMAPSVTPSATPSVTPSLTPSADPSIAPSADPSITPSAAPSVTPSAAPSVAPSVAPSAAPSATPVVAPSVAPSNLRTPAPSAAPAVVETSSSSSSGLTTPIIIAIAIAAVVFSLLVVAVTVWCGGWSSTPNVPKSDANTTVWNKRSVADERGSLITDIYTNDATM